ncbi:MAG: hypothetical protein JXQ71_13235 [Verrucomicrobia bacterium]|nr:hypothetical protein [Verrucomicrobiota bacterium]
MTVPCPLRLVLGSASLILVAPLGAQQAPPTPHAALLQGAVTRVAHLLQPPPGAATQMFQARLHLTQSKGLPASLAGQTLDLAFQPPDCFRISARIGNRSLLAARHGQQAWIYAPDQRFGVLGKPGLPRFAAAPHQLDATVLGHVTLPLTPAQCALAPLLFDLKPLPPASLRHVPCHVLNLAPKPEALQALNLPPGHWTVWLRTNDLLPLCVRYRDGSRLDLEIQLSDVRLSPPPDDATWQIPTRPGDHLEIAPLSHLTRFAVAALTMLRPKLPTLGPATGERRVLATEGKGRLERIDGTRVLFLRGTPEEMGAQHGKLLRKEIRRMVDQILYGVGVASSLEKGRWFFAEMHDIQRRIAPFVNPRHMREMDAIASAAGCEREEIRLANFFPELFHCSGFALFGRATADGRMLHGRILDYLRGVGLEQHAVVIVLQPDRGHPWVNVSYAGFVGSVTAMNRRHLALGEMGGRGEGRWDGKPMAQLVRDVMEQAETLDQAAALMRRSPRTCEYYYVLSHGTSRRAVGIAATPETFDIVHPGQSHPLLPHAIPDAVLMSADDRYETLAQRVKAGHGRFTPGSARDLMRRPVAMKSNIQSVLFAPETLEFWVANADAEHVASETRYTRYNLAELLGE